MTIKRLASLLIAVAAAPQETTFYRGVLPILQERCQSCHRTDEIGPMPLMSYD